jgi:hypothetical protein
MLTFSHVAPYATLQAGVFLIAAVLWFELHREERRRRLARSIQSLLTDEDAAGSGEKILKRAA